MRSRCTPGRRRDPQAALDRLRAPLSSLAARHGLAVEPGRMVIELRPQGMDKGQALLALAAQRQPSAVMFCGDDLGDVAAFDAVRALRGDGTPGLTVFSGSAEVTALAEIGRPGGGRAGRRRGPARCTGRRGRRPAARITVRPGASRGCTSQGCYQPGICTSRGLSAGGAEFEDGQHALMIGAGHADDPGLVHHDPAA